MTEEPVLTEHQKRWGLPGPEDHWIVREWQKGVRRPHLWTYACLECRHAFPEVV